MCSLGGFLPYKHMPVIGRTVSCPSATGILAYTREGWVCVRVLTSPNMPTSNPERG